MHVLSPEYVTCLEIVDNREIDYPSLMEQDYCFCLEIDTGAVAGYAVWTRYVTSILDGRLFLQHVILFRVF